MREKWLRTKMDKGVAERAAEAKHYAAACSSNAWREGQRAEEQHDSAVWARTPETASCTLL